MKVFHDHDLTRAELQDRFYGRLKINSGITLLQFSKNSLEQRLLHAIKYHGRQDIARFFGRWIGSELKYYTDFPEVDVVVPVPQHWRKRMIRGYNQVDPFAKILARELGAVYCPKGLKRKRNSTSLVKHKRWQRAKRNSPFVLRQPRALAGQRVLLADDILTTGSTLEHCGQEIAKAGPLSISIVTIATA